MKKITLEETTKDFNVKGSNGKERAIAFFEELWPALDVPPTKKRYQASDATLMALEQKATVIKGRRGDGPAQENFIQLLVEMVEAGRSDVYNVNEMMRDYGQLRVFTISERISGLDKDVQVNGNGSFPLFHTNGQLSPGAMMSLLEGETLMKYNDEARRWILVRLNQRKLDQ